MDTPFNGKISLKLCTESLAHKSDFLAEAVKKSNSKKIEFSSTSHLNPVDFFIFLFSSSCLSVTIILSDNTVRNIKVTPKAVEVKIYQKLSVQRNYPFNEIYSTSFFFSCYLSTELQDYLHTQLCQQSLVSALLLFQP